MMIMMKGFMLPVTSRFRLCPLSTICALLLAAVLAAPRPVAAQAPPAKPVPNPSPDLLVLANGDTLHGKFVSEVDGKVTFHSDPLGDISLTWDKIKELHSNQRFAVLDKSVKLRGKKNARQIPVGTFDVANQAITVHPEVSSSSEPIPVKNAQYIMDEPTLNKQVYHEPSFFSGWSGPATAGATIVTATQNQYTVTGSVALARVVPTASWLDPHNRTTTDFSGSYGKITQPGYYVPPATPGEPSTYVPAAVTKTAIYHADAERDQYFSPRFYTLAQTAFDHNFGQDLALQQIYGGGIGWTAIKTPKQEADLRGTIQYESQKFISGAPTANQNLVGSTFAVNYVLHLKLLTYTQAVAYIPAYNQLHAYSGNESNTVAFPAYKSFSFSVGTIDSYLNDPPLAVPPTLRNSFQFTMGVTYTVKSKY